MAKDIRKQSYKNDWSWDDNSTQTHVHEFLGSTKLAELEEAPHNHRFAGVSRKVIPVRD